jgi:hypothetical protein
MVDVTLTVIAIIVYIVIFALCTYVLILYSHPDDNTDAYFPKVVVVRKQIIYYFYSNLLPEL